MISLQNLKIKKGIRRSMRKFSEESITDLVKQLLSRLAEALPGSDFDSHLAHFQSSTAQRLTDRSVKPRTLVNSQVEKICK